MAFAETLVFPISKIEVNKQWKSQTLSWDQHSIEANIHKTKYEEVTYYYMISCPPPNAMLKNKFKQCGGRYFHTTVL